jgi:hypothetical protein
VSLLEKNRKLIKNQGLFAAVTGQRLSGKSTLAGTLPGKTAMLTAKLFETGSASAVKLASEYGNKLDVFEFSNARELIEMANEAVKAGYDNLYIDGASGLTEVLYRLPEIQKLLDKNQWDAYAKLADYIEDVMLAIKPLAEKDGGVNVFFTAALEPKYDQHGNVIELAVESKGKSVIKNMRKIFPVVVALRPKYDQEGRQMDQPELVTKTDGVYGARIDSLLSHHNPGKIDADLTKLIALIKEV